MEKKLGSNHNLIHIKSYFTLIEEYNFGPI